MRRPLPLITTTPASLLFSSSPNDDASAAAAPEPFLFASAESEGSLSDRSLPAKRERLCWYGGVLAAAGRQHRGGGAGGHGIVRRPRERKPAGRGRRSRCGSPRARGRRLRAGCGGRARTEGALALRAGRGACDGGLLLRQQSQELLRGLAGKHAPLSARCGDERCRAGGGGERLCGSGVIGWGGHLLRHALEALNLLSVLAQVEVGGDGALLGGGLVDGGAVVGAGGGLLRWGGDAGGRRQSQQVSVPRQTTSAWRRLGVRALPGSGANAPPRRRTRGGAACRRS